MSLSRLPFELASFTGDSLATYSYNGLIIVAYPILGCVIDAMALVLLTALHFLSCGYSITGL